ncbi:hypothetical protein J6590_070549 [Homalodisca vitripennis]|nr:hypothetical protein J6590_070549 [Homalodisca vitripennis]
MDRPCVQAKSLSRTKVHPQQTSDPQCWTAVCPTVVLCPPSRESGSPLVVGSLELNSRPSSELQGSGDSSPEQDSRPGTSPRINKFLAREPPDGCERVSLKFSEDASNRKPMLDLSLMEMCPIKPSAACQFKPSLGSAFMPLSRQAAASASASHEPPTQL